MAEQAKEESPKGRRFSTKGVLLITLMVGLASGAVAYEIASIGLASGFGLNLAAFQSNNANLATNSTGPYRWEGHGGCGPGGLGGGGLVFGARSEVANVTVTGFSMTGTNQMTVTLAYAGTGTTPSVTINGIAQGISNNTFQTASGSLIEQAGWTSGTTVTLTLTGAGTVTPTTAHHVAVLIVPYTGA